MTFNDYLKIFIENDFPLFLQKYLYTDTMRLLRYRSQFCGCDYTKIYSPILPYTRFNHSIIVALINYHFTHDKKSTIASLLHDRKTPCFAHVIDYVLGDYEKQESSEEFKKDPLFQDKELLMMLKEDRVDIEELEDLSRYPILENKSPKLCADRLDGVLHTCAIWLHTNSLKDVKEVYEGLTVLDNKGELELGFKDEKLALKFIQMVLVYAKELQSNRNKFTTQYLCDVIKTLIDRGLITFEDLYTKPESEILSIISTLSSWEKFQNATNVISSDTKPRDSYSVSIDVKKRNVIPLVDINGNPLRINEVNEEARKIYEEIEEYHDKKYGFVRGLKLD
ncbi:MAG: hypothetical protein HFI49_00975 [Bacilli bacterium]|jgi:HD superfamily phosphohydrolase|nr:hypothetical protein [Bacilli bacterium]